MTSEATGAGVEDHFAEVLRSETAHLTAVIDIETLRAWRGRLADELMTPRSPYARALARSRDTEEGRRFLDRWQQLLADMIRRILRSGTPTEGRAASRADAHEIAALILATLHGGSILSRVAQSAGPLDSALDLALAPLLGAEHTAPEAHPPLDTMDSR